MIELTSTAQAATFLGVKATEVDDVLESPAGPVIVMATGVTYVVVPDDQPDGDGKTGLMYLAKPNPDRHYDMGVYTPLAEQEPEADEEGDDEADEEGDDEAVPEHHAAVIAWVGDDPARAERAWAVESTRPGGVRSSVEQHLTPLLEA